MIPRPGDTVRITPAAGAQFRIYAPALLVKVTKVEHGTSTPDHMLYLAGYRLNADGDAVEHRPMLLVVHAGVELVHRPAPPTRNGGPRIPQQRRNELSDGRRASRANR